MKYTFTFPNGYEVEIFRTEDVLKSIDDNIIDKDIALEVISQCEQDCAKLIENGEWAALPFLGNFRRRQCKDILNSKENKELIETAKETLFNDKFLMFRKDLAKDASIRVKNTRFMRYEISKLVTKNKSTYKRMVRRKGEHYTNLILYSLLFVKDFIIVKTDYYGCY